MAENPSVFRGCGREKSKKVSTRLETLDLEQSDDMRNNWLGHVGSEGVNCGGREWTHTEKKNWELREVQLSVIPPSYFSEKVGVPSRSNIGLSRHGSG